MIISILILAADKSIMEWVLLRPKAYSLLLEEDHEEIKKAKGIQKAVIKKELTHLKYKNCYQEMIAYSTTVRGFQSKNHQVSTYERAKIALSPFDDKRCWIGQNESLAFGHWRLISEPPNKKFKLN